MTANQVLSDLDSIATDYDSYEFGLPMYNFKGETDRMEEVLKNYAKFHVEAALKSVSDKFKGGIDDDAHEEIFSSYPLDNIK